MNERPTMRDLLDYLRSNGLVSDDGVAAIAKRLVPVEPGAPLFVRCLMAFGAWISAFFFTAFVMNVFFGHGDGSSLAMGIGYLAGATMLHRVARHFFFHQVALALLVAGFIIALVGVGEQAGGVGHQDAILGAAIALAAALYVLYPDDLQRFMMPLAAAGVAAFSLLDYPSQRQLWRLDIYVALELAAAVLIFTNVRLRARLLPLGYAMAAGALLALATHAAWREDALAGWLFGRNIAPSYVLLRVLAAAAGLWVIRWAACETRPEEGAYAWLRGWPVPVAMAIAILFGIFLPPGVLIGLLLMVMGRGCAQRRLEVLGVLALAGFLADFYYSIPTGFMEKSFVLIGSGVTLLGAGWVFTRTRGTGAEP